MAVESDARRGATGSGPGEPAAAPVALLPPAMAAELGVPATQTVAAQLVLTLSEVLVAIEAGGAVLVASIDLERAREVFRGPVISARATRGRTSGPGG